MYASEVIRTIAEILGYKRHSIAGNAVLVTENGDVIRFENAYTLARKFLPLMRENPEVWSDVLEWMRNYENRLNLFSVDSSNPNADQRIVLGDGSELRIEMDPYITEQFESTVACRGGHPRVWF